MGRKCGVEDCLSDSNRPEDAGVTFHKVPMHSDIRPKWISLCRIPKDKRIAKVIYICSRHFLRVDFCNFKGKKYMLRQGVLPSVFPWDKSKLEAMKDGSTKSDSEKIDIKDEPMEETDAEPPAIPIKEEPEQVEIKEEPLEEEEELKEPKPEGKEMIRSNENGTINFAINSRIEALDHNNIWYPARIIEEDYEENEVLIHFEKFSTKYDEWICMDSPRLRPIQASKKSHAAQYIVGERCLACWSDARKFPATVTKILPNDVYEVLFDDGFVKNLKAHRMAKSGKPTQASPLFDPVQSTKQERRDKKRKINVAQLFGKRPRLELDEKVKASPPLNINPDEVYEPWVPQWEDGKPVGIDSSIVVNDGTKGSIIVPDPRLPEGWAKHLVQRTSGASAGKWDTIIVTPSNRKFRSRGEIKHYLEETNLMKFNWTMFDFSVHRHRNRKYEFEAPKPSLDQSEEMFDLFENSEQPIEDEEADNKNHLKIPLVDSAYQCPIEGCGKTYRRENLAQMHVKHYHPEYTKFLDSTPNVADLAYARTVGESFDKSPKNPNIPKPLAKIPAKVPTKAAQSPQPDLDIKPQSPLMKQRDSEIIKLLNNPKPEIKKEESYLPSGLPPNMYPDFKLKDLLNKSESIPIRDDLNLRALSTTRPPAGIKTLLPVRSRNPDKGTDFQDTAFIPRDTTFTPITGPNNVIIEGGQLIKIVKMKQEEIINCTCGFTEEDGLMIQCDLCLCWQHAFCNSFERESDVPENYTCYICQNPSRQRASKKYYHDQEWLKHGSVATTKFHTKDDDVFRKRFEKLKKTHDACGGLLELRGFANTLDIKLKIAEAKNHPKLYLWSKPWEKLSLPEKIQVKEEEIDIKEENKNESMLLMMLKDGKQEDGPKLPIIPEPEAAIDSDVCRVNLLEHIAHAQSLVEERLDEFEKMITDLEEGMVVEDGDYPRTRQTINMLLKDLNTLQEFSQLTTL